MPQITIPINEKDHAKGSKNAPVTLIEYGDFQCLVCRLAVPIIQRLCNELGGQMQFIFRHFPLKESHPQARIAAEAVEAAAFQDKFWEMHDLLYEKQLQISPETLPKLAEQLHLDVKKFESDLDSPSIKQKIESDFQGGIRSGVNGTPCFFINNQRYDGDASYDSFKQALLSAAK